MRNENKKILIFSCSGAADVGDMADRVTRRLSKEGFGKMYCLAGVGGKLNSFIDETNSADQIIAIDGCSHECAKHTLQDIVSDQVFVNLESLGFQKGQSPANGQNIKDALDKIKLEVL